MVVTMMTVEIHGAEKVDPHQSYVIVANHQSLLDIYLLYGLGMDIKWVMKKELRSVPVLGLACELMGHIIIDRSNTDAAVASINSARSRISNGMCVIFFPEGTRSRHGEVGTFKKGAFKLATELGIPLLPISIHGSNKILPSGTLDWRPGRVRLKYHDPIPTERLGNEDVARLAVETQGTISYALTNN
jgi:1-acyl-sn-glycerol-3-phosphate acyltransferase